MLGRYLPLSDIPSPGSQHFNSGVAGKERKTWCGPLRSHRCHNCSLYTAGLHFLRLKMYFLVFKIQLFIPTSNSKVMRGIYSKDLEASCTAASSVAQGRAKPSKAGKRSPASPVDPHCGRAGCFFSASSIIEPGVPVVYICCCKQ